MVIKRGISSIVATALIIMVTISAVGIIITFLIPIFDSNLESVTLKNVELEIDASEGYSVWDADSGAVDVQVRRGNDNLDITGISFIFGFGGRSETRTSNHPPERNQAKVYTFGGFSSNPSSVRIAPIIKNKVKKYSSEVKGLGRPEDSGGGVLPKGNIPPAECDSSETNYREFLCLSDVVAYWPFDEDTQFNDSSGNGHDGTKINDTRIVDNAAVFDGVRDRILVDGSSDFNLTNGFTISAWVKPANISDPGYFISQHNQAKDGWGGFLFWTPGEWSPGKTLDVGAFQLTIKNVPASSFWISKNDCLSDDDWSFIVVTWNGPAEHSTKLYCNSELTFDYEEHNPEDNHDLKYGYDGGDLLIGAKEYSSDRDFNGSLDEFVIFDKALTAEEILEIYDLRR